MKKLTALLLTGSMIFTMAGCGNSSSPSSTATDEKEPVSSVADTAATVAETTDTSATDTSAAGSDMDALIEAAKAEGSLTVYGSCEEAYLSVACQKFEKMYGIKVDYQRLSTGEVYTKIQEENGSPSGDVWFGGTTDPYNEAAAAGLLEPYDAINSVNLISDTYKE